MNEYPLRRPVMSFKRFIPFSATVLALHSTAPYREVQKLSGCIRETQESATLNHDDSQDFS